MRAGLRILRKSIQLLTRLVADSNADFKLAKKKNCGKLGLAGGTRTTKIAYSCLLKFV